MAKDTHLIAVDLGRVLVEVDHMQSCRRLAAHAGLEPQQVFQRLYDSPAEHGFDTGRLNPVGFTAEVNRLLGTQLTLATLRDCWCGIFELKLDVIAWLEAQLPHATCVLVSNTNVWHYDEIRLLCPLLNRLDGLVLSFSEGTRKPEDAYYQRVLMRWPRQQRLFIDDRAENCAAAQRNSFQSWQFDQLEPLAAHVRSLLG